MQTDAHIDELWPQQCIDGFLGLYRVLNFLLPQFTNLPPANNGVIGLLIISLPPYRCLFRSPSYCVSHHAAAFLLVSRAFLSLSPPFPLCLFRMNSGLHCRVAGCYDSRLLLTVFGLGGQGNTHMQSPRNAHTYTRTLTSSSSPSTKPACTHSCRSGISFYKWSSSARLLPYFDCLLGISLYLAIVRPVWLYKYIQKHVWSGSVVCATCASGEALHNMFASMYELVNAQSESKRILNKCQVMNV